MLQEVATIDGVIEMQPLGVPLLARERIDAVDPPLGAHAVRAFDRRKTHQVDVDARFGKLHGGGQTGQPSTDDHHALVGHRMFCLLMKLANFVRKPALTADRLQSLWFNWPWPIRGWLGYLPLPRLLLP